MQDRVRRLLKERNAIMLAHNYQPPEVQDAADLCGDSLELSIKASQTEADVIVFCGVHFMAETASILSPDKTVLLPRMDAGCLMSDMIDPESLEIKKASLPPMPVVTYVNSSAAVKALSTICCTSANVIDVVNSLDAPEVLMTPDRNLAQYAAAHTDKILHLWDGYCPSHEWLTVEAVGAARAAHPDAVFIAHPECRPDVVALADEVASTSGMLRYARASDQNAFIIGTEVGLLYPLQKENPGKQFFPASSKMYCKNMKKISLEDVVASLEGLTGVVKVPDEIRIPALSSVQQMVDLALAKK